MKKQEYILTNHPDSQIKIVIFPKNKIKARKDAYENKVTNDIDILELRLTDIDGNELPCQMTPDEALEISGLLNSAVAFYISNFNKEYKKAFTDRIKRMEKRRNKTK